VRLPPLPPHALAIDPTARHAPAGQGARRLARCRFAGWEEEQGEQEPDNHCTASSPWNVSHRVFPLMYAFDGEMSASTPLANKAPLSTCEGLQGARVWLLPQPWRGQPQAPIGGTEGLLGRLGGTLPLLS